MSLPLPRVATLTRLCNRRQRTLAARGIILRRASRCRYKLAPLGLSWDFSVCLLSRCRCSRIVCCCPCSPTLSFTNLALHQSLALGHDPISLLLLLATLSLLRRLSETCKQLKRVWSILCIFLALLASRLLGQLHLTFGQLVRLNWCVLVCLLDERIEILRCRLALRQRCCPWDVRLLRDSTV